MRTALSLILLELAFPDTEKSEFLILNLYHVFQYAIMVLHKSGLTLMKSNIIFSLNAIPGLTSWHQIELFTERMQLEMTLSKKLSIFHPFYTFGLAIMFWRPTYRSIVSFCTVNLHYSHLEATFSTKSIKIGDKTSVAVPTHGAYY